MPLDPNDRFSLVSYPFDSLVVDIDKAIHEIGVFERVSVNSVAVILGCDEALSSLKIHAWMIDRAVTKFEFVGLRSRGKSENLCAKAYS